MGESPAFSRQFHGMMSDSSIRDAYDRWALQYDVDENPTRDLNAKVLREQCAVQEGHDVLEVGCGTGLNTEWLADRADSVVATDFSEPMLERTRQRLSEAGVILKKMDVTEPWTFDDSTFDGVVATLVLEHVDRLAPLFRKVHRVLRPGGHFYVSELHPYRQFTDSQANFHDADSGDHVVVDAFTHPVSEFVNGGLRAGFAIREMGEWYDSGDDVPRLLSILFET